MDMTKPENRTGLQQVTPEDGPIPLGSNEVLEFGAAWDEASPEEGGRGLLRRARKGLMGEASDSDADAIAVMYTRDKPTKYAGLDNTDPYHNEREGGRSVTTSGDNRTGAGDGDDEVITVRLGIVPQRVTQILISVGAFKKGTDPRRIRNLIVTIYNSTDGVQTPMAFVEPTLLNPKRMLSIGVLERTPNGWTFRVIDDSFDIEPGDMDSLLRNSVAMLRR